jgi:hypothetical protein
MTSTCHVEVRPDVATENPICIGKVACQFVSFQGLEPEEVTVTEIGCICDHIVCVRTMLYIDMNRNSTHEVSMSELEYAKAVCEAHEKVAKAMQGTSVAAKNAANRELADARARWRECQGGNVPDTRGHR